MSSNISFHQQQQQTVVATKPRVAAATWRNKNCRLWHIMTGCCRESLRTGRPTDRQSQSTVPCPTTCAALTAAENDGDDDDDAYGDERKLKHTTDDVLFSAVCAGLYRRNVLPI